MITIKTGAYSNEEIVLMSQLIYRIGYEFLEEHCAYHEFGCENCPVRHICADIRETNRHLDNKVNTILNKEQIV